MSEINVTPLVDVMLVLLIVFMVAAPLLTVSVPVSLPEISAVQSDTPTEPLLITVDADQKIYLMTAQMSIDELAEKLGANANKEQTIHLLGDRGVKYGLVIDVVNVITRSGYKKFQLEGLPETTKQALN